MSYSDAYDPNDGVAIIGLAGRFPGAGTWTSSGTTSSPAARRSRSSPTTSSSPQRPTRWRRAGSRTTCARAGSWPTSSCSTPSSSASTPTRGRDHRPAAAPVPRDGLGGAGARGLRPADLRAAPIGVFAGMSNNYYFLPEPPGARGRHRHRRLADHDDGQREGLPRDARLLQARPAGPGAQRPDRLLDLAGRVCTAVPEPAQLPVRHGAGRRRLDHAAAEARLPLPGGRDHLARRPLPDLRRATPRAPSSATASASSC